MSASTARFASRVPCQRHLSEDTPADQLRFINCNAELAVAKGWKSITKRKASLPDADEWNGKEGKLSLLER